MTYNITGLDTGNTFYDYVLVLNNSLGGYFSILFLFAMFIILLLSFKAYDTKVGLISAATITSIVGVLFIFLGFMETKFIFIPVAVILVGLFWKWGSE